MPGDENLEQLADDTLKDRRIAGDIYCGACGYNLRTLPYLYRCPECGQDYNARPLKMKGIFLPQEADFPRRDAFEGLFLLAVGGVLLCRAYIASDPTSLALGIMAAGVATVDLFIAYFRFITWLKAVKIARRIEAEEGE